MYHLDYIIIIQGVGECEEILLVEGVIIQVIHWIWDGDVPLSGVSVHGGGGTENIDYRIQVIMRGLILSDVMYLAICSDQI